MIAEFEGDYAFLSNFHDSPFTHDGITYPTNEHFFQAMKTTDLMDKYGIAGASTPGQAKRMGRRVILRPDWEQVKEYFMEVGLRLKFADPELRQKLLDTGDEELVEGNWWHDNIWGSCYCPDCIDKPGRNLLGKQLMKLRKEIQECE